MSNNRSQKAYQKVEIQEKYAGTQRAYSRGVKIGNWYENDAVDGVHPVI
jgi:hypothetical protein